MDSRVRWNDGPKGSRQDNFTFSEAHASRPTVLFVGLIASYSPFSRLAGRALEVQKM